MGSLLIKNWTHCSHIKCGWQSGQEISNVLSGEDVLNFHADWKEKELSWDAFDAKFCDESFYLGFHSQGNKLWQNKGWRWKMYQKGWGLCATASGAGPRYIRLLDQVITVSADVLAPNGARTSTDTVLTTKLNIFPLMFIWPFTDLIAFQFLIAFCKIFPAFWELTEQLHCGCAAEAYFTNNFLLQIKFDENFILL